jgi:hypothetical protein
MRLIVESCPSKVNYSHFATLGLPVREIFGLVLYELLFFKQDIFRFEISMSIAKFMDKGDGF